MFIRHLGIARVKRLARWTSDELVALGIENMCRFDFVGLTECFDADVRQLNTLYGWDLPLPTISCNQTPDRPRASDLDGDTLNLIRGITRLDARLYQHARYVLGPLRAIDDRHKNILQK